MANSPYTAVRELSTLALLSPTTVSISDESTLTTEKTPRNVVIGQSIFRKFICVQGCGACCRQLGPLTLDFIPTEQAWLDLPSYIKSEFSQKYLVVETPAGSTLRMIYSMVKPRETCRFLNEETQGCNIWQTGNPLGCSASARIQIQHHGQDTYVLKKGFARAWRWKEPPQCEYPEAFEWDPAELALDVKVLYRFDEWANYFHIPTVIPELIQQLKASYEAHAPRLTPIALS